jgi:hypothetical protein
MFRPIMTEVVNKGKSSYGYLATSTFSFVKLLPEDDHGKPKHVVSHINKLLCLYFFYCFAVVKTIIWISLLHGTGKY